MYLHNSFSGQNNLATKLKDAVELKLFFINILNSLRLYHDQNQFFLINDFHTF